MSTANKFVLPCRSAHACAKGETTIPCWIHPSGDDYFLYDGELWRAYVAPAMTGFRAVPGQPGLLEVTARWRVTLRQSMVSHYHDDLDAAMRHAEELYAAGHGAPWRERDRRHPSPHVPTQDTPSGSLAS